MESKVIIREIEASSKIKVIVFTSERHSAGIVDKYKFLQCVREYVSKLMPEESVSFYDAVNTDILSVTAIVGINEIPSSVLEAKHLKFN